MVYKNQQGIERYHKCQILISDSFYTLCFSLMLLHKDYFRRYWSSKNQSPSLTLVSRVYLSVISILCGLRCVQMIEQVIRSLFRLLPFEICEYLKHIYFEIIQPIVFCGIILLRLICLTFIFLSRLVGCRLLILEGNYILNCLLAIQATPILPQVDTILLS